MNNFNKILSIVIFFSFLIILPLATDLGKKETFSQMENRPLEEKPTASFEALQDKSYMHDYENYFFDHFFARTSWISIKNNFEIQLMKKEINNVFVLDDRLIERFVIPDIKYTNSNVDVINEFSATFNIPTFFELVPTAAGIYSEILPEYSQQTNQKAYIQDVYEGISKSVFTLDAVSPMVANKNSNIYYKTDHHWTTLGAFCVYSATISEMGQTPISPDLFDVEHVSYDFYGSLHSKLLCEISPDTIDYYHYKNKAEITSVVVDNGAVSKEYPDIYFRDYLKVKDKYSSFLGQNEPLVTIKTNAPDGKKLLVFKDSYANSYIPFLAQHYSEITVLDPRYITPAIAKKIDVKSYDQALFLYNASTFATQDSLKTIGLIK